jgi:hypothetical protein
MFRIARILTFTGVLLFSITNAHAAPPFGAQVRGNDLETGKSDEVGGVGLTFADVDNLPEYRSEAGLGGATFTPVLKAEASNPNSANDDDRTSSTAEAYQSFMNTSGSQLDVALTITLDASFTSTGPEAGSFALADVRVYGDGTMDAFDVIDSPICPSNRLGFAMMLGDAYFCGGRLGWANMFLRTDPSQASSSDSLVQTLSFSVAPGESFGVHGILRANAFYGSSDAFNTLSMGFDDVSAENLEASSMPQTSVIPIPIDIKPNSDPNSINPRSKGVVPVAVLASTNFDALQVDVSTVRFGPEGALPAHDGHVEDVNDDGFMDMMFHFKTQETGIVCDDTEATLTGEIFAGTQVAGTDTVNTVGCKGNKNGKAPRK